MKDETRAVVVREMDAMELPDVDALKQGLATVRKFQSVVRELMIPDHDFGTIPGTPKPTLLKPGAEKIAKILGLADTYEIVSETEDWIKPFFAYKVRCYLKRFGTEGIVSTGLGECNSLETKYRWRWLWPGDVQDHQKGSLVWRTVKGGGKQYRVENDQIFDQVNTILKMAKKRALVDAALSAGRLSDVFTQDIEDFAGAVRTEADSGAPQEAATAPKTPDEGKATAQEEKAPATRGTCPVHGTPFLHRKGISKTGKPYDFWSCPAPKDKAGNYCKEEPKDSAQEFEEFFGEASATPSANAAAWWVEGPSLEPSAGEDTGKAPKGAARAILGAVKGKASSDNPDPVKDTLREAITKLAVLLGQPMPDFEKMTNPEAAQLHNKMVELKQKKGKEG